jgi:rhodanese-related sulfurtransferase
VATIHPEINAGSYCLKKIFHAKVASISTDSLKRILADEPGQWILIDLRISSESQKMPVKNAFSLPYEELAHTERDIFIRSGKKILFLSKDGRLAEFVCMQLSDEGIKNILYLENGIDNWHIE